MRLECLQVAWQPDTIPELISIDLSVGLRETREGGGNRREKEGKENNIDVS